MPRKFTIDQHKDKQKIIKEIVSGKKTYREISEKYGVTISSVHRYMEERLIGAAAENLQKERKAEGDLIIQRIDEITSRLQKLYDALDEWLQDPDDPDKYFIGPRGYEIEIVYEIEKKTKGGKNKQGIKIRRKESLRDALQRLENKDAQIENIKYKHADPRKLIIDNANALIKPLELIGKIKGAMPDERIDITISMVWMEIKKIIVDSTADYPEVRERIVNALKKYNID